MKIRVATNQDRVAIQRIHLRAFPESESERVAKLAMDLLAESTTPETLSFVAETEGAVVGHVALSPVLIASNQDFRAYILAPLGISPESQKRRIGSKLIENGLQRLSLMEVNVVFVYGDPNYYRRFGFSTDVAQQYIPPYKLQYPFGWQATVLNQCAIGEATGAITCVASLSDPALW